MVGNIIEVKKITTFIDGYEFSIKKTGIVLKKDTRI